MLMPTRTPEAVSTAQFAAEVRAGLTKSGQKELPSKYLYDAVGSALFEVIGLLPEYGLTRAGERLLKRNAEAIVRMVGHPVLVAELGSGSGKNTRWILEALSRRNPTTYHPIDISGAALVQAERELDRIDAVSIVGFEREYLDGLREVAARRGPGENLLVLFLGGTIGNFDGDAGDEFLKQVRALLIEGDHLLLSTDLEKPVKQLMPAYDDAVGVTAAFNLNLLARINRELDADFDLARFQHLVRYDPTEKRIEMHLRSTVAQTVRIGRANLTVSFGEGETIWTESSHKYPPEEIPRIAERTGYRCMGRWADREWPFSQNLFVVV
jgi:dimethylhistidine N-methyltransferase